jgi:hypothetical protein
MLACLGFIHIGGRGLQLLIGVAATAGQKSQQRKDACDPEFVS